MIATGTEVIFFQIVPHLLHNGKTLVVSLLVDRSIVFTIKYIAYHVLLALPKWLLQKGDPSHLSKK